MKIKTMPNKNRKLIVASEKLFQPNNILTEFAIDHDIVTFSYNPQLSVRANSKAIYKKIIHLLEKNYDTVVFMGHGLDCNVLYELYDNKSLIFTAGVFVNFKQVQGYNPSQITQEHLFSESKIYSFTTGVNKKRPVNYLSSHQSIPTILGIRSKRLAQEIFGCVVYGAYGLDYLEGSPSSFVG